MNNHSAKRKVLVTGGTGFLGAYIIKDLLEKGWSVRALRRSSSPPAFIPAVIWDEVEWVNGDILDVSGLGEAMEGTDAVIHAAAKISFSHRDRRELFRTNIEGTANVVNIALEQNIRRFVHVSSVAALGRTGKGENVTEGKSWEENRWNTNYAISKFRGEVEVWRGIGEGLPAVIVNPSTILGYGDWDHSSCTLFRSAWKEFPWYTEGVNGFVDVKDVARAVVSLLETDIVGERYILNGDNWTFRRVFESIAAGFGKKPPTREATPFLAGIAWRTERIKSLFSGKPSMLTRESARVAQSLTYFDNSKIRAQLPGFAFTPLEKTIKDACEDYLRGLA
ncbi:NAD-dependent epimerase/dehydratase family protein [Puia dinghuensis]|uniref:NAD-dependent epimerase n=1 Tax=Puia dinghuensis TaxID=1792502 RepID=A0A8J2UFE7_9BACT|nr:NAD-dependent epimerase/dehydratase family protein [Puia dinghuensis]GGB09334.1 NAD-dependent epimerase [Puia dinghuensis]